MTRIQFFHGAADRLQTAAHWLIQRNEQKLPALVFLDNQASMDRLDRLLWTHPGTGFGPHCCGNDRLCAETPIVLTTEMLELSQDQCLLNLANEVPTGFSRFEHLVEIVSTDDSDRLPGRERFRFYRERGYDLQNIDVSSGIPE